METAKTAKKILAVAYSLILLRALLEFNIIILLTVIAVILLVNEILGLIGLKVPLKKPV